MSDPFPPTLLDALLESWDRNNMIMVSLLDALPDRGLEARATQGSPTIAQLFAHIHFVRLAAVYENDPALAATHPGGMPADEDEWLAERDIGRVTQLLNASAGVVRGAVEGWLTETTRDPSTILTGYDHPLFLLQHLLWHEGYHVGQMKLALRVAGQPMTDRQAGPVTWDVWRRRP